MTLDIMKWEAESKAELQAALPKHMWEDFVVEITEGWVFWPTRGNRGFLPGYKLVEIGNLLLKINKPYNDDFNAGFDEQ